MPVIADIAEYLRRVEAAVPAGQKLSYGRVTYFDDTSHNGRIGPFYKRKTFQHPSEFRIALSPGTGARFTLRVGDLSDLMVATGSLEEINWSLWFDAIPEPPAS